MRECAIFGYIYAVVKDAEIKKEKLVVLEIDVQITLLAADDVLS